MKKIVVLSLLLSSFTSVFADPLVYDFKALVKHSYLKAKVVNKVKCLIKYTKSSALKGYLVMDADGVTSKRINAASTAQCLDVGRNRGFLVVQNQNAEKTLRGARCLPVILDAKHYNSALNASTKSVPAEGCIFIGGDSIAAVRPQINDLNGARTVGSTLPLPAAGQPGGVAYADYAWQSIYLLGQYSGPKWNNLFSGFEQAWDNNLPETLRRGTVDGKFFHDAWFNGSGIGKATLDPTTGQYEIYSLAGNLTGGLFLSAENGIAVSDDPSQYAFWDSSEDPTYDWSRWEDQFVAKRLAKEVKTWTSDKWQDDIWLAGAVDQTTTDVMYGTWSIKIIRGNAFTGKLRSISAYWDSNADALKEKINLQLAKGSHHPEVVAGGDDLLRAILAVGYALNKNVNFADGTEIYSTSSNSPAIPMLTPKFCTYYGLNNFKDAEK